MPSAAFMETAAEVIARILSESAFIFVDPLTPDAQPDIETWKAQGVMLGFHGHRTGAMSLWAGEDFLCTAAANMLGIDAESEQAAQKGIDAFKEILNIIVGNLLTTVYGSDPVFDLDIPKTLEPEMLIKEYAEERSVWFEAEGFPIMFILEIERE